MRSYLFTLLFVVTLISCSSEDDEIDCGVIDMVPEVFFIEYLDNEGNNLLDNGTYIHEEIEITVDGEVVGEVFTNTEETFLIIPEFNAVQKNESEYLIKLSPTETDVMQLEYSEETGICGHHIYTVENAVYNGEDMELERYGGNEKITVIKTKAN